MDKQQKELKKRIEKVYKGGFTYIPENWPKGLWGMPTINIIEYITNRFEETDDEIEYYTCLVYLYNNTTKYNKSLVEWKDSTNYQKFLESLHAEDMKNADKPVKVDKPEKVSKPKKISKPKKVDKPEKVDYIKEVDNIKEIQKTDITPVKLSHTISITKNFM